MKYKVGDKVRIKTWDRLKSEYLIIDNYNRNASTVSHVFHEMECKLKKNR